MIFKSLFAKPAPVDTGRSTHDLQVAVAVLLSEAAAMDDDFGDQERTKIQQLIQERFALTADEATELQALAEATREDSVELFTHAKVVKDAFSHEERIQMMEMLWDVILADGIVHDYEANLARRLAGLLYVSDQESGAARKKVQEKRA